MLPCRASLIERPAKNARITIFSARPGVVIGKKGEDIENLKRDLGKQLGVPVAVNIEEVRKPEIDAKLIADSITQQLEKRIMFRRAMKRAMQNAMRLGALGIKIMSCRPSERHRDCPHRVVPRRPCATCTRCALTLTTALRRPRPPTASSASRSGSTRVTRWAAMTCRLPLSPRSEEERRPRGPRRDDPSVAQRPSGARVRARRPVGGNAAPADGSDKPAEAIGADARQTRR